MCGLHLHFSWRSAPAKFQEHGSSKGRLSRTFHGSYPANFSLAFFPCLLFQPAQGGMPEGPENDRDYRARFIQTVNFSHSGYKVN